MLNLRLTLMIFNDGEAWWEELVKRNMMEDI